MVTNAATFIMAGGLHGSLPQFVGTILGNNEGLNLQALRLH